MLGTIYQALLDHQRPAKIASKSCPLRKIRSCPQFYPINQIFLFLWLQFPTSGLCASKLLFPWSKLSSPLCIAALPPNPCSSRVHREFRAGSSSTAPNAASVTQSLLALSCFPSNTNINWGNPAIWLTCLTSVLIIEVPKGSYFPRTPNLWLWWLLLYKMSY